MRIALAIEYDGSDFYGWQRLSHGPTVQGAVEAALSKVANVPVEVVCSGRTDAGVHAFCQIAHFDAPVERSMRSWMLGGNSNLPPGVAVLWAQPVADDFHARYDARARRYRYRLVNRMSRAALERRRCSWEPHPLDADAMHRAAQALVGEHDFSAFRSSQCQAPHARRCLHALGVERDGEYVSIDVQANAFLHHMVRNIVGSLLPIGRGEQAESWMAELLAGRDREVAGPTASPNGLHFVGALYPAECGLPASVSLPPGSALAGSLPTRQDEAEDDA
ncbi:MAG: tRNA pseudouridine(38-40) synthase TruA [Lysobacteraceae bacterium]